MHSKKCILVTGATAGIGEAIAIKLAEMGHRLILTGRRAERLDILAKKLTTTYQVAVKTLAFDIRNHAETQKILFHNLVDEWQKVDVLVNNAGLAAGLDPFQSAAIADWETMIDTNIKGVLYVSQVIAQQMVARKAGQIIQIGSIAAKETYPNGSVYAASKHAIDALTKGMRYDLAPFNIRVGAVHPGLVETEFSLVRFKGDAARANQVYKGYTPLVAADVAEAVSFMVHAPEHVNIADITILPTAQASAMQVTKNL